MSQVVINDKYLNDIADAIRDRNGTTNTYKPREMASAIYGLGNQSTAEAIISKTLAGSYSNERITDLAAASGAFANQPYLVSVSFPNVITMSDSKIQTFKDCPSLTTIYMPQYADYIPAECCENCTALTSVDFSSANRVGADAFTNCTALTSISLPNVLRLNIRAFKNCTALTSISLPNVIEVYGQSFEGCSSLTKLDFKQTVTFTLCVRTFANSALDTLILRSSTACTFGTFTSPPAIGENGPFYNTPIENGTGYIYVPAALVETYKTSVIQTKWGLGNQIRAIEDYPEICNEVL